MYSFIHAKNSDIDKMMICFMCVNIAHVTFAYLKPIFVSHAKDKRPLKRLINGSSYNGPSCKVNKKNRLNPNEIYIRVQTKIFPSTTRHVLLVHYRAT